MSTLSARKKKMTNNPSPTPPTRDSTVSMTAAVGGRR
jgi:hypothetical protein